jgi:hypothetical protein
MKIIAGDLNFQDNMSKELWTKYLVVVVFIQQYLVLRKRNLTQNGPFVILLL